MNDVGEFLEKLGKSLGKMDGPGGWGWGRDSTADDGDGDDTTDDATPALKRELTFGEQPELEINASALSLRILPLEAGETPYIALHGKGAEGVDLRVDSEGGNVKVSVQRGRELFGWTSHLRLTAAVPAGIRLRVRLNAGRMRVIGVRDAEYDLRADASHVTIRDSSGRLRLSANAGKVDMDGFTGVLDARADAGALRLSDVHLDGDSSMRSNAGAIRCERLRLDAGNYQVETNAGSIRLGLLPGTPISVEASASLGSVNNQIGGSNDQAPVHLKVRTDLGSVRLYYDGPAATPLHNVPISDERAGEPATVQRADERAEPAAAQPAEPREQAIPFEAGEPAAAAPESPAPAASASSRQDDEMLRILGMVERREITSGEAAALIAALRDNG